MTGATLRVRRRPWVSCPFSAGLGDYFSALPKPARFRVGAPERPLHRPSRLLERAKGHQAAQIPPGAAPKRRICVEQAQAKGERQHARSIESRHTC